MSRSTTVPRSRCCVTCSGPWPRKGHPLRRGRAPRYEGLMRTFEPVRLGSYQAWQVVAPGPMATHPLRRTDLHVAEGDLPVHRPSVVPGHEVVGTVVADAAGFAAGERVGIAWLRHTCGGYAEYAVVPADFAYWLPEGYSDAELAPLLCAGIIGFRALRRAGLPAGGTLGVYGFGASAHLAVQVALAQGARVHVLTRSEAARKLAMELGASSAAGATDPPPEPLDAAILFAPAGELVPVALAALDRGGTLAIAGIHLTDIPSLSYQRHLFQERTLRSVTANTREDGRDFLAFAAANRLRVTVSEYALSEADRALADLAADRVNGAAVLRP